MTAPDARQSDDLRVLIAERLAERFGYATSYATVDIDWEEEADALLPVVAAWHEKAAEAQARARAAVSTDALRLIDRHGCENIYGGGRCSDPTSGRTRGAKYGADDWCAPCIAAAALAADDRTDPA